MYSVVCSRFPKVHAGVYCHGNARTRLLTFNLCMISGEWFRQEYRSHNHIQIIIHPPLYRSQVDRAARRSQLARKKWKINNGEQFRIPFSSILGEWLRTSVFTFDVHLSASLSDAAFEHAIALHCAAPADEFAVAGQALSCPSTRRCSAHLQQHDTTYSASSLCQQRQETDGQCRLPESHLSSIRHFPSSCVADCQRRQ